jgi:type IV pilus assembly protein PilW
MRAGQTTLRQHSGVTLVELMIALAIGMVLLGALTIMFMNQSKVRSELDKANRMTDNGRYAIELLAESLRLAGYYAEFDPTMLVVPATLPDPCSTLTSAIEAALPLPVQNYNASSATATIASPPSCLLASMIKPGSDILVIRRVDTRPVLQANAVLHTRYLQTSLCQFDIVRYKLSRTPSDFTLRQKDCTESSGSPYADVHQMLVQIYFISPYNRPGDGIPTLKRLDLVPNGWSLPAGTLLLNGTVSSADAVTTGPSFVLTPLVEGIEYLQISFGLDTDTLDGKGLADSYSDAPQCPPTITAGEDCSAMASIVEAKIYLLARNTEPTAGYIDTRDYDLGSAGTVGPFSGSDATYKRQVYSQFVRVMNVVGRRELQ